MKQITSIAFTTLRNDEFLGLQSEGVKFAKAITDKEIQKAITDYETAVQNLASFLEASITESAAKQAGKLDSERNEVYMACRRVAQASTCFPDAAAAETGALIWKVFSESPNPSRINQAQSSGILMNIIQGLKNIGDEKLEACGFKVWLDKLETANNQFMEADMARFSEQGKKEFEYTRKLRAACVEAYKVMIAAATFKAAAGSESCNQFLESLNAAVVAKKSQIKARKGRAKQKTDVANTTNAATVNAADNAEAVNAAPTTDNASTVGVANAA